MYVCMEYFSIYTNKIHVQLLFLLNRSTILVAKLLRIQQSNLGRGFQMAFTVYPPYQHKSTPINTLVPQAVTNQDTGTPCCYQSRHRYTMLLPIKTQVHHADTNQDTGTPCCYQSRHRYTMLLRIKGELN